jgi:hypothetical protein
VTTGLGEKFTLPFMICKFPNVAKGGSPTALENAPVMSEGYSIRATPSVFKERKTSMAEKECKTQS